MSLPDRDRRWNLNEAVEYGSCLLGDAARHSVRERLRSAGCDRAAARCDLGGSRDNSKCDRRSENLQVVVVYLVLQTLLSDLQHRRDFSWLRDRRERIRNHPSRWQ